MLCEPLAQRLANVRKPEAAVSVTRRPTEYLEAACQTQHCTTFPEH